MKVLFLSILLLFITIIVGLVTSFVEPFDTVVSKLENDAGFFSMLFFLLNHYIYCKKTHTSLKVDTSNWLFTYKLGWNDYFEDIDLSYNEGNEIHYVGHKSIIEEYPILEYKNYIHDFYKYNQKTKNAIDSIKSNLNLFNNYDSIFIRRGDKLGEESVLITEEKYVDLLLHHNPFCSYIFLQTDDYNCYLNIKKYVETKQLDIRVETLCDKDSVGVIVHNRQREILNNASVHNEHNKDYLTSIKDKLNTTKAVEDMSPDEKYKHVMDMIIGIDILIHSNICITDYQSNVARFIKLKHVSPEKVYDVNSPDKDIDYTKNICPAFSF